MYFAITGGIACGKSALAGCLAVLGVDILDADDVVHRLQASGGPAIEPIREQFGNEAIDQSGAVDRKWLGERVFADVEARMRLNAVVHPLVRACFGQWRDRLGPGQLGAGVIPLLFETGWQSDWDTVVCITCPADEQWRRLEGRGLTQEAIRQRIASQWPQERKARRADHVVRNDGTTEELMVKARDLLQGMLEKTI